MPLIAALALAASGATLPHCSWDRPGVNPSWAMWSRRWIAIRTSRLRCVPRSRRACKSRDYDEIVSIQRDEIKGSKAMYGSAISEMHFGANNVCKTVSRAKWTQKYEERGLVYCEEGQCILVPTVCRNVSRIQRLTPRASAPAAAVNVASAAQELDDPQSQLEMDPPSAGALGGGGPDSGRNSFSQLASGANSGLDGGSGATPGSVMPSNPPSFSGNNRRPHSGRLQRALAATERGGQQPAGDSGTQHLGLARRRPAGPGFPGQAPQALNPALTPRKPAP